MTYNQGFVTMIIISFHGFFGPLKDFICNRCFSLGKSKTFQHAWSEFVIERQKVWKKLPKKNVGDSEQQFVY